MQFIKKVGNLRFMYEQNGRNDITVYAINGTDIVASEVYFNATPKRAMVRMLQHFFDTFTREDIAAALPHYSVEYYGDLIYGKLAGFDTVEYFKRIENTDFFKHYTRRPAMTGDELRRA